MSSDVNVVRPPVVQPSSGNNIIINPVQRLNPVLECIRNVGKEFGDIVPDFQVGRTTGVLFLSLRYHRLHPEYIHQRIEKLGHLYTLRILLILCDITEHQDAIRELTKICLINNITVVVAWSSDGVGHYLSTFKQFEHKPPDMIRERVDKDYNSILRTALTSISRVNKTDVETLRTAFGSFSEIGKATSDQLQNLPGFGPVKVKKFREAFEKPFRHGATKTLSFNTAPYSTPTEHTRDPAPGTSRKGKGKARSPSATRETSPAWEDELDVIDNEPNATVTDPQPASPLTHSGDRPIAGPSQTPRRRRSPSPIWDLELDLND